MSHEDRREHIEDLRIEILCKLEQGGFDEDELRLAWWTLDQAEATLDEPDFDYVHEGVFLVYLEQANKYINWARNPIRAAEAISERQRITGQHPKSRNKALALELYSQADPKPATRREFKAMLDKAGLYAGDDAWHKWFTAARKLGGT